MTACRILPVVALALLASRATSQGVACARHDWDDTTPPCVIGHVFDAATRRPIVSAEIRETDEYRDFAHTDSTGVTIRLNLATGAVLDSAARP
jgi:signal recognition particle receptor subunit beta